MFQKKEMLPNDFKLAGISFFYSDAIALLQHSPIHRFLYSFPNIRFQQFRIPPDKYYC